MNKKFSVIRIAAYSLLAIPLIFGLDKLQLEKRFRLNLEKKLQSEEFSYGLVNFEDLRCHLSLDDNQYFKEYGVIDVNQAVLEFGRRFKTEPTIDFSQQRTGIATDISDAETGVIGHALFLYSNQITSSFIFTRGHERGHLLYKLNKCDLIYNQYPLLDTSKIREDEDFADLCGFIALRNKGYNLKEMCSLNPSTPSSIGAERVKGMLLRKYP